VVEQIDGTLMSSPFHVRFGKLDQLRPYENDQVVVRINGSKVNNLNSIYVNELGEVYFSNSRNGSKKVITENADSIIKKSVTNDYKNNVFFKYSKDSETIQSYFDQNQLNDQTNISIQDSYKLNQGLRKNLSEKFNFITSNKVTTVMNSFDTNQRPDCNFLNLLNLKPEMNEISFEINIDKVKKETSAFIYKWNYNDKIIISDIDGTITKSDVRGQILTSIGKNWYHENVAKLFNLIKNNGYKIVYLSARSVYMSEMTKNVLKDMSQDNNFMPRGPVLLNPVNILNAFHTEVIEKNPDEFKTNCLIDLRSLFDVNNVNPFYAGFGNKLTDITTYKSIGIDTRFIFIINQTGIVNYNHDQKNLELDVQSRNLSSYLELSNLVNIFFPSVL
jgi:phosphatidate phosphatase PAH1